jgi:hypothetical protein
MELFPDGRIILIWGEGTITITNSDSIAAGVEYPDEGLHFPATETPFVADGLSSSWPTDQFRCFLTPDP